MHRLLLDSNILLFIARDEPIVEEIDERLDLFDSKTTILTSIVCVAELLTLARLNGWGDNRTKELQRFLERIPTAWLSDDVVQRYVEIDTFSQGRDPERPLDMSARNMGKNDLWIAATASVLDATLVTSDQDFDHLDARFLTLEYIERRRKNE